LTDRYWHAPNIVAFLAQIVAILPVYALCVVVVFRSEARSLLSKWTASRILRAAEVQKTGVPL